MALIICPECGKQFSDKAAACPNCGCPTSEIVKTAAPKSNSAEAEKQMLALVEQTLEKARKAGAEYELAADEVQRMTGTTTIDLFSNSARSDTSRIVEAAVDACDGLFTAYQTLIPALDGGCRSLLRQNPGAKAIKAVAGTMAWLNEESKIENNYAVNFNGADLGNVVKSKYLPSSLNLSIQGFWESEYHRIPDKRDAEVFWKKKLSEHERKVYEAERAARQERDDAKRRWKEQVEEEKKRERASNDDKARDREHYYRENLGAIKQKIEYNRAAYGLYSCGMQGGEAWVKENGEPVVGRSIGSFDMGTNSRETSKMHDLCQIITVDGCCFVGLQRNGTVSTSKIGENDKKKYNISELKHWDNMKKIVVTINTGEVIGLRYDGTCANTRGNTENYRTSVYVSNWSHIVDIVAGCAFVAGLREDGTVCVSGETGKQGFDLGKACAWKNVVLLAAGFWQLLGVTKDGQVLQIGSEDMNGFGMPKDIVAIAQNPINYNYYALQSDGKVIGILRDRYHRGESKEVKGLADIIALYSNTGYECMAALRKDGALIPFGELGNEDSINLCGPEMPSPFKSYDEYQKKERKRISEIEMAEQRHREEKELKAQRRAKGLCQHCGGELEKKLFGWKCKACGQRKDY